MSKKLTTERFIERAKLIHGNKYNYSLVDYINNKTKIKIICPIHGIFEQKPAVHINQKCGCKLCSIEKNAKKNTKTTEQFIEDAKKVHNEYDYSKTIYEKDDSLVNIICPKHGMFYIKANHLLNGNGCQKCAKEKIIDSRKISFDNFLERAVLIHGNKYDYSLTKFTGTHKLIKIICPVHGVFEQMPFKHLQGQGCPICKESKGEKQIRMFCSKNNIKFVSQYIFEECVFENALPFDFYLPNNNVCIEYDGIQHFDKNNFYTKAEAKRRNITIDEMFSIQMKRDEIKNSFCKTKGIKLIRIKYNQNIEEELSFLL